MYHNFILKAELQLISCIYQFFTHLKMDIWVVCIPWLLWMMLLWSLVHKYLEFLFSVLSGISLGVKFLDYSMVILNLHYWGATKLFPIADASLYTASVMHLDPGTPHPHPYLLSLFNYTFSSRCQLAHPWGFHLLFLMINHVDHKLLFDKHRNHQTKPANSDVPKDLLNESKVHWKRCWSNWASQRAFFVYLFFC